MDEHLESVSDGRKAFEARDWAGAARYFDVAPAQGLNADDLCAYAEATWWLGRIEDTLRLTAAACTALLDESRPAEAAWAALRLGIFHLARGDEAQGMGWMARAGRLAEHLPENPVHGWLAVLTQVEPSLAAGRWAAAVDAARRTVELGRRLDDPGLVAAGIQSEGRALIRAGHVVDGLALLDEAMITALEGRLLPFITGTLYCHTIAACHGVADVRRMTRWTELAERWLATLPDAVFFVGLCAVHRAQLELFHGRWDDAERTALQVVADLDANRVDYAAEAWYVVAEARRLRGDPAAASAYDEAHARGRDPQPGRALLQFQSGDPAGATTSVRSALAAVGDDPLLRVPLCAAAVDIALGAGRPEDAAPHAAELAATATTYGTSGLVAIAADARGALLLAAGRAEEALPVLRDACRRWYDIGAPHESARTCARLAAAYHALGDEVSAAAEEARAAEVSQRLRLAGPVAGPDDRLSHREREVLRLVVEGCTNREIGERLFISDRTVGRHLTNIYNKLGVTSRTQAARRAIEQGLTVTR